MIMTTRRVFLRNSAMAMVGVGAAPAWLARAVYAGGATGSRKKVLVTIFQRGAADGLNMVVPFAERSYYSLRPSIAIPQPGKPDGALDLDGRFGLHPSLEALHGLYNEGRLAIVQAAGSPDPTRSHFDAQDYMESGTPGRKSTRDGWLSRAIARGRPPDSPLRAVSMGPRLPRTLRGPGGAVAVSDIRTFGVKDDEAAAMLETMYSRTADAELSGTGKDAFGAVKLLDSIRRQPYAPANGAAYSNARFSQSLRQIAQLIKADAGVEVAFADLGGWDHHANEPAQLTNLLREFAGGLGAFARDLGDRMEDVVLVTMSEFGRTARENGNRGTDHGHANVMLVMGGPVRGGRMHGRWPGIEHEQLYEGRDLAVTTDFRDVLSEIVADHLGQPDIAAVFPGYKRGASLGLVG
jgi:uncharacterized protein (DUF1501 family)